MCGRFALSPKTKDVEKLHPIKVDLTKITPNYNIAPSQKIACIINDNELKQTELIWGLIPFWAKDQSIGNKLINARAETIDEKPAFKNSFKKRRCLILTSGFYEWKKISGGKKIPYFITLKSSSLFTFAGLWDEWTSPTGEIIQTATIITTDANQIMSGIHNRMPVILSPENSIIWLDMKSSEKTLKSLLMPYDSRDMQAYEVSLLVNNPRNNAPELIEPLSNDLLI